jgi:drug/metabolite transporter (DMT)-like permease
MQNGRLNSAPVVALVLATACWGAATVITKHILANIPPLTLLVLQLTISVSFLWMIVFAQRLALPQRREIVRLGWRGSVSGRTADRRAMDWRHSDSRGGRPGAAWAA